MPLVRVEAKEVAGVRAYGFAVGLDPRLAGDDKQERGPPSPDGPPSSWPGSSAIRTTRLSPSSEWSTTGEREPSGVSIS